MIKTINIGDKEVRLDNNIGWTLEYRDQFNTDILPTLMPLIAGAFDVVVGLLASTGKKNGFSVDDFVTAAKSEEFTSALIKLSSFEIVDFINITWAMAKCADPSIPEPKRWVREFDGFYFDEIVPAVVELCAGGMISRKNLERLQNTVGDLKPEEKTNR